MREATASRKVPEGKLVSVRVRYDDVFETVELRGDFFLEPPDAIAEIERAVEGLSVDASTDEIADAVGAVDAELIGFDADDVALAVRAAVEGE